MTKWLTGFGPNPITDVLAGALWQVRSTLLPVGAGVGAGGVPTCLQNGGKNCSGQNLKGANLAGMNLSGVDFSQANLTGANLTKATLDNAVFIRAALPGANLTNATGQNVNFADALLAGSYRGSPAQAAIFTNAKLQSADFYDVNDPRLWDVTALSINMQGVNLTGANLTMANLSLANLTDANLTGADLNGKAPDGVSNVGEGGADLSGAILVGANLNNVQLVGGQYWRPLNLASAQLDNARLQNATFTATDCENESGDTACAILDSATFYNANLTGATLQNITAYGTKWADYKVGLGYLNAATCPNGAEYAGESGAGNCPVGRVS